MCCWFLVFAGQCKQYFRASDGPLAGVVFEGRGDAQKIDVYTDYGGSVYGWNENNILVLLPSAWSWSRGRLVRTEAPLNLAPTPPLPSKTLFLFCSLRCLSLTFSLRLCFAFAGIVGLVPSQINIPQSFGNNLNIQQSATGDVRVVCWESDVAPDFESEWDSTIFVQYETAYREVAMNLRHFPAKVLVLVKTPGDSRIYRAVNMNQNTFDYYAGGGLWVWLWAT